MKHTVRGNTDWNRPPWPGKDSSNLHWVILWQEILVRNMELTNHHQMEENGKGQKERGDASQHVLPNSQNPPRWNPSWLSDACVTSKDSQSEWLARGNLETNPITIKPETASHVAEQFSWVPLPRCSPLGHPFPIKFFALSARVPPWTIHFRVLDKSHSWALEGVLLPAKTWVAKIYVIYNGYRVHCQNNLYPILWRK